MYEWYLFKIIEGIGPRTSTRGGGSQAPPAEGDAKTEKAVGSGKATLRLKAKGPPVVENIVVRSLISFWKKKFFFHSQINPTNKSKKPIQMYKIGEDPDILKGGVGGGDKPKICPRNIENVGGGGHKSKKCNVCNAVLIIPIVHEYVNSSQYHSL